MKRYEPKTIEPKWQQKWDQSKIYKAVDFEESRPKFVMLTEFPYPSGDGLHLGHVREYTLGDIIARHKRMNGYNVLFPMGYDSFGLPTENYAIKKGIAPQEATDINIARFASQFVSLGFSIDWDRQFTTTDPSYYKWTQWLFIRFFKAGIAYQDKVAINWCPKCKTGLANEEVINGRHERCDTIVEKRELKQWVLKITKYADRLIDGLKTVDFPSKVADQQINWIGKSKGAEVQFEVENSDQKITVFTTRPDTLAGASFIVLAPENKLVEAIVNPKHKAVVNSYIKNAQSKTEIERQDTSNEKTGVSLGIHAINPLNGNKLPIWTSDYVLNGYGTGAIMAVPAHDERDYMFAKKFDLPIIRVIDNSDSDDQCTTKNGLMINSGKYDGLKNTEAKEQIVADLNNKGLAEEKINYKLRDWIFSRQHYWGEPIPIIHCPEHGPVAVPDDQLPVTLPKVERYEPTDNGQSPLSEIKDWVETSCPICGQAAKRETDTMPNWAGSSWYYLRFFDPKNDQQFASPEKLKYWGEVDLYLGGMEHTTLHLLYSRFWHQFFYDLKLVPYPEPYASRRGQGIILAADGTKMSKSKGNVINPNDLLDQGYGADAIRLAITFLAPYDQTTPWSPEAVAGTFRFLQRAWTLIQEYNESSKQNPDQNIDSELLFVAHKAIKRVSEDIEQMSFNTAIAGLMEYINELYKLKEKDNFSSSEWQTTLNYLAQLLAPLAPHLAEELWSQLANEGSVHLTVWPKFDQKYIETKDIKLVIQINGKVRAILPANKGITEDEVMKLALCEQKVATILKDSNIVKTIYIKDKLLNIVI